LLIQKLEDWLDFIPISPVIDMTAGHDATKAGDLRVRDSRESLCRCWQQRGADGRLQYRNDQETLKTKRLFGPIVFSED
jgi:hypothetical protein